MLSREALVAALPLTSVLDSNRIVLSPVNNSPLFELVRATRSDPNFNTFNDATGEFDPSVDSICYIANKKDDVLGYSPHDKAMDDITVTVGNAVREHMLFAKNVVAPAVEELVNKTILFMQEQTPSSLLGMEVITWSPPKPMLNSSLETSVRRFEEVPYDVPKLAMKLPSLTVSEIIELMQSGSGGLDKDIAEWASIKGESFFINIWENVFQIKQAELNERVPVTFRDFVYDREDAWDCALAIYLISRRLVDDPLPNTEMNMSAFNSLIVEYRNQSGVRLCHAFDDLNKVDKVQQLIKSMTDRKTVVYESVYRKWVEAGGENEVLFGNLLATPSVVTVDELNARATELKEIWNKHAAITAIIDRNKRFSKTKEVLLRNFQQQIRDVSIGDEATLANRETILKRFGEQLEYVREDEIVDLWTLCLKLVCRSRFYRTEAERILLGIERVKKENPQINVREAAAVSIIEYCAWWIASQFTVKVIG